MVRLPHYIGGAFADAVDAGFTPSLNPSSPGDVVAMVPNGTAQEAASAADRAHGAAAAWRALAAPARGDLLHQWAQNVRERAEEIAQAVTREVGKPISEARGEVGRAVTLLRYYAAEAVRPDGMTIPAQTPGSFQFARRFPLGVCALVTPWNFPVAIPLWKAAPALAFGNTVVLKPSELSAFVANLLAETCPLPPGVFNVVHGLGASVGEALMSHPVVRAVSFTGSDVVGRRVAEVCAPRNVKYQTEMGGKNVGIVLQDADLPMAARLVAGGAMRYAGQKCTATSRVVVDRAVKGPFMDHLLRETADLRLGPVTDPEAAVGPLISEAALARVRGAIGSAVGTVVCGGAGPVAPEGFFLAPTIVDGVAAQDELAQRELFGPVLAVIDAEGFDEAIDLANQTGFGLSAAVYTRDVGFALAAVERVEAGMIRINGDTTGVDPHAPFGGVKGSSSGTREQGPAAREFYTETKTVQVNP